MKRGDKFTLVRDVSARGYEYKAGQTGEVRYIFPDGSVSVEFDGYSDERARDDQLRRECGEGANIVPWSTQLPADALRIG